MADSIDLPPVHSRTIALTAFVIGIAPMSRGPDASTDGHLAVKQPLAVVTRPESDPDS